MITLSLTGERFRDQWGSRGDNLIEAATLAVGALLGVVMTHGALYPLLVLVVLAPLNLLLAEGQASMAELREHARTDTRTGLLNARGLAEQGPRVLQRSHAAGEPASVLIIDLDHFKTINDSWGHPAGDAVLSAVGRMLRETVRPGDIAARDGGEEFVIVLPDTVIDDAAVVADRIRAGLAALEVVARDKNGDPVVITKRTASIGVAVLPDHGTTFDDLRHAADAALYEAKNAGRDRTVLVTA
ncbi:MAG: diguanylate cyclase [Actinophytocola sp.]|nr:diguanylate cyclase [Actinophytocola sp.]